MTDLRAIERLIRERIVFLIMHKTDLDFTEGDRLTEKQKLAIVRARYRERFGPPKSDTP